MLNSYCIPTGHVLDIDCVGLSSVEKYDSIAIDLERLSERAMCVKASSSPFV